LRDYESEEHEGYCLDCIFKCKDCGKTFTKDDEHSEYLSVCETCGNKRDEEEE
jgi:DNA-directed RNA polymerase subunit RPC12/RpoP